MEQELRELTAQQARTNALLEALTHEVRAGFGRGREQFEDHGRRLNDLEHSRTGLRTLARVAVGLASLSGLFIIVERIAKWLSPS